MDRRAFFGGHLVQGSALGWDRAAPMADAQVVHQTACLHPLASDGLLLTISQSLLQRADEVIQ